MDPKEVQQILNFLKYNKYPEDTLASNVPSKAKSNFKRKSSSFRVPQDSKLFELHGLSLIITNNCKIK